MKISNRDWVQLSAYLDGELSAREAKKLENRLAGEPGLQAALEELRSTKRILAQTPKLKVPRNFTLSTQQAGLKRTRSAAVGYSWAAAALSFLFIAVLVLDLGSVSRKGVLPAVGAPRSEEALPEAALEAAPAADALEEPAVMEAEESVESQNGADQEIELAQEAAAPAAEEQLTGEVSAAEGENIQEDTAQEMAEEQTKTAPEEADRAAESEAEEGVSLEAEEGGGAAPAPTAEGEVEGYYQPAEQEVPPGTPQATFPWIRIIEILLGLGAAGFASAAWIRRRRKS